MKGYSNCFKQFHHFLSPIIVSNSVLKHSATFQTFSCMEIFKMLILLEMLLEADILYFC